MPEVKKGLTVPAGGEEALRRPFAPDSTEPALLILLRAIKTWVHIAGRSGEHGDGDKFISAWYIVRCVRWRSWLD